MLFNKCNGLEYLNHFYCCTHQQLNCCTGNCFKTAEQSHTSNWV